MCEMLDSRIVEALVEGGFLQSTCLEYLEHSGGMMSPVNFL